MEVGGEHRGLAVGAGVPGGRVCFDRVFGGKREGGGEVVMKRAKFDLLRRCGPGDSPCGRRFLDGLAKARREGHAIHPVRHMGLSHRSCTFLNANGCFWKLLTQAS